MTTIRRLPYRTPKPERIVFGQWSIHSDDGPHPLPAFLPHWDPAITIQALVSVQIDCQGIALDCGLDADARLRLAAIWHSTGTVLSGPGDVIDLDVQSPLEHHVLQVQVDGTRAAQMVNLNAQLLLLHPGHAPQPFAPVQPGNILAAHMQSIRLEGEGSRFPVQVVDFRHTAYATTAGWALYWDEEDLHRTFLGSVRLNINAQHLHLVQAVSQRRPESEGVREAIRFDVARTLIRGALRNDEFVTKPDSFSPDSVGAAIRELIERCFPNTPIQQCREIMRYRLDFETRLQAGLQIFGGV